MPRAALERLMLTMRAPSGYGSPLSSAPYTMLNIVVVSPMPSVKASTATAVRPGAFNRDRRP
jgi:hypothetical protein